MGLSSCEHCHKPKLSHVICPHCGFYKGEERINVLEKELKKQEKAKKKQK